jgi:hypothetical protein
MISVLRTKKGVKLWEGYNTKETTGHYTFTSSDERSNGYKHKGKYPSLCPNQINKTTLSPNHMSQKARRELLQKQRSKIYGRQNIATNKQKQDCLLCRYAKFVSATRSLKYVICKENRKKGKEPLLST